MRPASGTLATGSGASCVWTRGRGHMQLQDRPLTGQATHLPPRPSAVRTTAFAKPLTSHGRHHPPALKAPRPLNNRPQCSQGGGAWALRRREALRSGQEGRTWRARGWKSPIGPRRGVRFWHRKPGHWAGPERGLQASTGGAFRGRHEDGDGGRGCLWPGAALVPLRDQPPGQPDGPQGQAGRACGLSWPSLPCPMAPSLPRNATPSGSWVSLTLSACSSVPGGPSQGPRTATPSPRNAMVHLYLPAGPLAPG